MSSEEFSNWALTRKKTFIETRARMLQAIRRYFFLRDYLEVETPYRIPAPAPETHIDAVSSGDWFLHTSPELCMKRLLAAGYVRIFQICKCFRLGERGVKHLPEFTMLEWYHAGIDYKRLMEECEELLSYVFHELGSGDVLSYQGYQILLQIPWERITVEKAFSLYAPITLHEAMGRGCFDELTACCIEPHLGVLHPVFLHDYPVSLGALARAKKNDPGVAERFELYIGGMELANAFSELTDADEQRRRFRDANDLRLTLGKTNYPQAEPFLRALPFLPESAGIALGVDRLAMLVADCATIDDIVAFAPEDL